MSLLGPRARLAHVEAKIAQLRRRIDSGLTCCGEIGGIRSRSQKRKNQITDRRVDACTAIVKLYPLRDSLRATVARLDRGEPEPVVPLSAFERAHIARPPRTRRITTPMRHLPPVITALCGNMDAANAYMADNEGEGLLAELPDGKCYIARIDDLGERVTAEEFERRITPLGEAIMQAAAGGCL